jgi:hypothetical protein
VHDNLVEAYWQGYLETLPADSPVRDEQYIAGGWGISDAAQERGMTEERLSEFHREE